MSSRSGENGQPIRQVICDTYHLHRFDRSQCRLIRVRIVETTAGDIETWLTEEMWPGL